MQAPTPQEEEEHTTEASSLGGGAHQVATTSEAPPAAAVSPSPSPSLSGSIGALGLSVDSVTLSGPIRYGLPVYDLHRKGRVIFSLRELEQGETWYTENHNSVRRISESHVLLGETIELPIPEEEDFDVSRGILTFNGEQPLLLEDTQVSAEAEVERLSGMKFYEGIPLSSVEAEGAQERGVVVFTLQQLPDDQPFYFDRKSSLTIARTGNNLYTINGKDFQGAVVRQVLPADSSLLDLVFPHGRKESGLDDDDDEEEEEEGESDVNGDGENGEEGCGGETYRHEDIMQQILAAGDASQAEEEEIARAMLREFDERLKGATIRRAQEKRRRLSLMMKQYSADPSSPFRALFLPPSPLSTSGTIPARVTSGQASDDGRSQSDPAMAENLVSPRDGDDSQPNAMEESVRPSDELQGGQDEGSEEGLLEEVDLGTPRHERRDPSPQVTVEQPLPAIEDGHDGLTTYGDASASSEEEEEITTQSSGQATDGEARVAAQHAQEEDLGKRPGQGGAQPGGEADQP